MKTLILILISLSSWAHATDLSNDVTSLNYYPHSGRYYVSARDAQTVDQRTASSAGTDNMYNENTFGATAAMGLSHGLRLSIAESYILEKENSTNAKGVTSQYTETGPSDPTITGTWRFHQEDDNGWSADVSVALTPSFGNHTAATVNQTGSYENGYWTGAVGGTLYLRQGINEWGANATYTERSTGKSDSDNPGNSYSTDALGYVTASFNDRLHLNNNWYVQMGLTFTFPYTSNNTYDNGRQTVTTNPFATNPVVTGGWRVSSMSVLSLNYSYKEYGTSTGQTINSSMQLSYLIEF